MPDSRQEDNLVRALRRHDAEIAAAKDREPLRTHDDIRKLSVEECIERKAEIDAVLSGNVPPEAPEDTDL